MLDRVGSRGLNLPGCMQLGLICDNAKPSTRPDSFAAADDEECLVDK
jgi:hypothetical protein